MLARCLSCYEPFPANQTIEALPVGRRIAFDPARGRLWLVCNGCGRWTLAPMEERWEALDALDRLTRERARLLRQGENVALFAADDVQIVRVGAAGLHEQAWWRYGHALLTRQDLARGIARRGKVIDGFILLALTGLPLWGVSSPERWIERARRRRFGRKAWRGTLHCGRCGHSLRDLPFAERTEVELAPMDGGAGLWLRCARCGPREREGGYRLTGAAGEHVARRLLAYENFAGGDARAVQGAVALIESAGSPAHLIQRMAAERVPIANLAAAGSFAAEIALNDSLEAQLLTDEVAALDSRWREEEMLAAIIDGELTPPR